MRNPNLCCTAVALMLMYGTNGTAQKTLHVAPEAKKVHTEGRINFQGKGIAEIYWPGTSFRLKFSGSTSVKATLKDERGHNYFNVIIDDSIIKTIPLSVEKHTYDLATGLTPGMHTIELSKRGDWFKGKSQFYGFELEPGSKTFKLPTQKRRIEFYGNSVTVGAAVEDLTGDSGDSSYTNNYRSYASITARHFKAGYSCIASSGIGLMVSWGSLIMPDIYNRLNPDDSMSKWNFKQSIPDVVVVNLLQNDQAIFQMPSSPQFKKRFGDKVPAPDTIMAAYESFIRRLKTFYPKAYIICTLGSMNAVKAGSPWPGYIEQAVARINDPKIKTHFFSPISGNKHPKIEQQQVMAESLINFIEQQVEW